MRNSEKKELVKNYELTATEAEQRRFKEVLRAKLTNKGIRVNELPELICYSKQSIYNFLSVGSWNRFLAATLAEKFKISEKEWKDETRIKITR